MVENNQITQENSSTKRLYRSRENRIIGGVCGGIAEYFDVDPLMVRIVWILITFFWGIGLWTYLIGLIIIPQNPTQETPVTRDRTKKQDKAMLWGSLLIIIGSILILRQLEFFYYIRLWDIPWQIIWASFLIIFGIFLIYNRRSDDEKYADADSKHEMGHKQFYRVSDNKMISGVCSGLAVYFDVDVTIVRLAWVMLTLASVGIGILAYLIIVIVFPEMPEKKDS